MAASAHRSVGRMEKTTIGVSKVSNTAMVKAVIITGTTAVLATTPQNTELSVKTAVVSMEKTTPGAKRWTEAGTTAQYLLRSVWMSVTILS